MARWTEEDIRIFWEMKREGATLVDIADRLGRNYTAVATYASKQRKKVKFREDTKMEVEMNNIAPEATIKVNTPVAMPDKPAPKLDGAIRQALDMIASQGLEFLDMNVSMNNDGAAMVLHFVWR
jgi:hypothetical protein